jgi:hypothetical protein
MGPRGLLGLGLVAVRPGMGDDVLSERPASLVGIGEIGGIRLLHSLGVERAVVTLGEQLTGGAFDIDARPDERQLGGQVPDVLGVGGPFGFDLAALLALTAQGVFEGAGLGGFELGL